MNDDPSRGDEAVDRVTEIVAAALELEGTAQASFLDRACGADAALRAEVESLLEVGRSERAVGFLEVSAPEQIAGERIAAEQATGEGRAAATTAARPAGALSKAGPAKAPLPKAFGPYRVLEALGQGGMGTVYLAEQVEPVERRVALKVIRGVFGGFLTRRFAREARTLARLQHPNIASLFEVGGSDDAPYVVMEWVDGLPITRWCDRAELTVVERLKIFRGACAGTQHAHEKGVLHCDLKPSNVLVTRIDDQDVAKVIDFGIARAFDDPASGESAELVLGSPPYISPEALSAEGRHGLDARTDVYSLGLVLYELLVGAVPFGRESRESLFAFMQQVTEEDPVAPSARLTSLPAERQDAIAAARSTNPAALRRQLVGDLDAIVLKAIARRPGDRYASVSELLADLERHASRRPVEARLPNPTYVAGRFARRHRGVVVAALLLVLALVAGFIARSVEAHRAQRALAESEQVRQFLVDLFESADPEDATGEALTVRELLDQGAQRLRQDLADQPLARARFLHTIGSIYIKLDELHAAAEVVGEALDLRRGHLEDGHPEIVESESEMGVLYRRLGRLDEAETLLRSVLAARQADSDVDPELLAQSHSNLGNLLWSQERYEEAEVAHRAGLEIRRQNLRQRGNEQARVDVAYSSNNLGVMLLSRRRYAAALPLLEEARDLFGREHSALLGLADNNIGLVHRNLPSWSEAETHFRRALEVQESLVGPVSRRAIDMRLNLIDELLLRHRWEEASAQAARLVEDAEALDDPLTLGRALRLEARAARKAGRFAEALRFARSSLEVVVAAQGPEAPVALRCRREIARSLAGTGDFEAAVSELRAVEAIEEQRLAADHPSLQATRWLWGEVVLQSGRAAEAATILRAVLATERSKASLDSGSHLRSLSEILLPLGRALRLDGRLDEADAALTEALDGFRRVFGDEHPLVSEAAHELGLLAIDRRQPARARTLLSEAVAIRQGTYPADDADLAASRAALGD